MKVEEANRRALPVMGFHEAQELANVDIMRLEYQPLQN
jgi:hypothetical protein